MSQMSMEEKVTNMPSPNNETLLKDSGLRRRRVNKHIEELETPPTEEATPGPSTPSSNQVAELVDPVTMNVQVAGLLQNYDSAASRRPNPIDTADVDYMAGKSLREEYLQLHRLTPTAKSRSERLSEPQLEVTFQKCEIAKCEKTTTNVCRMCINCCVSFCAVCAQNMTRNDTMEYPCGGCKKVIGTRLCTYCQQCCPLHYKDPCNDKYHKLPTPISVSSHGSKLLSPSSFPDHNKVISPASSSNDSKVIVPADDHIKVILPVSSSDDSKVILPYHSSFFDDQIKNLSGEFKNENMPNRSQEDEEIELNGHDFNKQDESNADDLSATEMHIQNQDSHRHNERRSSLMLSNLCNIGNLLQQLFQDVNTDLEMNGYIHWFQRSSWYANLISICGFILYIWFEIYIFLQD